MTAHEVLDRDAIGQATAVAAGEVDPAELITASVDRIERLDIGLRAVVSTRGTAALAELHHGRQSSPFFGVPLLLKDHLCELAGEPLWYGLKPLLDADHRPDVDSHLAVRFRDAGFAILGRTVTSELALAITPESDVFPPPRNPWDPHRSPGGSSAGAAVSVAARMVPVAHGTDMAGSIRVPAAWCGVVGLKPSRGRISGGPTFGDHAVGLTQQFVLCRSVRDAAAILDAVACQEPGDPLTAPPPTRTWRSTLHDQTDPLRIGVVTESSWTGPVDPQIRHAVHEIADLLDDAGHEVVQAAPPALSETGYRQAHALIVAAHARDEMRRLGRLIGRQITEEEIGLATAWLVECGRDLSATGLLDTVRFVHGWARRCVSWWSSERSSRDTPTHGDGFDLLLTPTVPNLAPPIGSVDETAATVFTGAFNLTGQPAISLPTHVSREGLPIGVQLVAAPWREDHLFRVASQLEAATAWQDRRPNLAAHVAEHQDAGVGSSRESVGASIGRPAVPTQRDVSRATTRRHPLGRQGSSRSVPDGSGDAAVGPRQRDTSNGQENPR